MFIRCFNRISVNLLSVAILMLAQSVSAGQDADTAVEPAAAAPAVTGSAATGSAVSGSAGMGSAGIDTGSRQQAMEHKFEKAEKYYAECKGVEEGDFESIRTYLKAFTDAEVMAQTMADPVRFVKLMQIVNDPRTMHVMMKCATEPVMWDTWVHGLSDYDKLGRAGMQFMNPAMYMKWMMAPMNPQMYGPMMQMMDPNYYMRWMTAMMNPAFYQPMFAFADPNWYTPRIQWMMDPRSFQPMFTMFGAVPPATTSGGDTE